MESTDDKAREARHMRRKYRDAKQWLADMTALGMDTTKDLQKLNELRVHALLKGIELE